MRVLQAAVGALALGAGVLVGASTGSGCAANCKQAIVYECGDLPDLDRFQGSWQIHDFRDADEVLAGIRYIDVRLVVEGETLTFVVEDGERVHRVGYALEGEVWPEGCAR